MAVAERDARRRIMAAAQEEFALKGFAGARVDDIACKAGINKALIYYYFKSKENLLQEIIAGFFAELLALKQTFHIADDFPDFTNRPERMRAMYAFFRQNKPVIRIILTELVKGETQTAQIIPLLEPLTNLFIRRLEELGIIIGRKDPRFVIQSTFYGLVPVLMFIVLEDSLAQYLETDTDATAARFDEVAAAMMESHRQQLMALAAGNHNLTKKEQEEGQ